MDRQEFRNRYREARKAAKFFMRFFNALKDRPPVRMWIDTTDACPGFRCDRLHGDVLHYGSSVKIGNRMKWQRAPRLPT